MEKSAIVIDTNIFGEPDKYDFNDIRINTFFNSLKDASNIDVYIPDIVSNEIKKHIKEALLKDQKNPTSKYFKDFIEKDFYEKAYKNTEKKFDKILKKYKIKTIKCDKYINISDVNNWYFNKMLPFEETKPKEFPDAMIISALTNYFKDLEYDKKYLISDDNGFANGLSRETDFIRYKDINSIRKEVLGYTDADITIIYNYLQKNRKMFENNEIYKFESYDSSDEIYLDNVEYAYIKDIDILEDNSNSQTIEVTIEAKLNGYFLIFDPYDSMYDNEDRKYYYIIQRECKTLLIEDESFFLEIIKDDNGKIVNYNSDIECKGINLLDYLNQMNIIYEN